MKIAGVIVLYNPELDHLIINCKKYINVFDKLILVDNTEIQKEYVGVINTIDNLVYIDLKGNKGLAKGLNIGCKWAYENNYDSVMLLDQDSIFSSIEEIKKITKFAEEHTEYSLVAPNIKKIYRDDENNRIFSGDLLYKGDCGEVKFAITSGSLIKLEDYIKVGMFDEKLFIMQIDQEFCYKLFKNNLRCYVLKNIYLYNELGNGKPINILGKRVMVPNYGADRYYYIFRNEWYLRHKWKKSYKKFRVKLYKYLILILFEGNIISKYMTIIKACIDCRKLF